MIRIINRVNIEIQQFIHQINSTRDFYDNPVDIVQDEDLQQFVFSYRCATKGISFDLFKLN